MNPHNKIRWLYKELEGLVGQGVLDAASADRIRSHYGPVPEYRPRNIALLVFGVIGAAMIGLGIILIMANNWDELSRTLRAGITFGLLISAQAIAVYAVTRRPDSRTWNEAAAVFLALCVGSAIALIGQTYHIPGDLGSFLLTWMLLILPLIYVMRSNNVAIGYLIGLTAWSDYVQGQQEHALWFWPLALLSMPYVLSITRRAPYAPRTAWLLWAVSLCATVSVGIALERSLPGLWIPVYTSLFGVMYLGGVFWFAEAESRWQQPLYTVGTAGLGILALMFTFEWPWESIGWNHYRSGDGYYGLAAIADYVLAGVLLAGAVSLLVSTIRRGRTAYVPLGAMPILAVVSFGLAAGSDESLWPSVLFNIYVFTVSIFTIVRGIRIDHLGIVNAGMFLFAALVILRFIDIDISFVVRGLCFIAIGVGFLLTNVLLIVRKRASA